MSAGCTMIELDMPDEKVPGARWTLRLSLEQARVAQRELNELLGPRVLMNQSAPMPAVDRAFYSLLAPLREHPF